jgi:hypothetical protein
MRLQSAGRISGLQIHQTSGTGQQTQIQTTAAIPCYWPKTATCVALVTSHVWPTEHKTKRYAVKGDELQRMWKEAFPAYCSTLNIETPLNIKRSPFLHPRKHAAPHFMEPEGSVPPSQQPTTRPYPEPREFSMRRPILSVYNQFQYYLSIHFYCCRGLPFLHARTKASCLPQSSAALSAPQALEGLIDTTATHTDAPYLLPLLFISAAHTALPHCATDVTCSYRPIASDSHRV